MTWQTKKLGSLGEFIKGSGVSKNEVIDSGLPAVRYGEIYTRFNTKILVPYSFINKDTALKATKITKGDILLLDLARLLMILENPLYTILIMLGMLVAI